MPLNPKDGDLREDEASRGSSGSWALKTVLALLVAFSSATGRAQIPQAHGPKMGHVPGDGLRLVNYDAYSGPPVKLSVPKPSHILG
jgi:hypothetical protein